MVQWMQGLIEEEDICVVATGNSAIDGACVHHTIHPFIH
jgi:hypothetical protein